MAKTSLRKGSKLTCVPCGREVTVDCCGTSARTISCCDEPMKKATGGRAKKSTEKK